MTFIFRNCTCPKDSSEYADPQISKARRENQESVSACMAVNFDLYKDDAAAHNVPISIVLIYDTPILQSVTIEFRQGPVYVVNL